MKKLSVLAIALAATCMFSGCGKETKQNVQPAEETYKNTESETSEECAAAQEEFSEEVVDTEESIDDEWTDEASELDEEVASVLSKLTPKEERVLRLRYGFDGHERTLEEVGAEFNVTRERIRQIESKALRKLSHLTRIRELKDFL